MRDSHEPDTSAYPTGTSPCTYAIELPCTEPYARWCGRTVTQLMGDLLPDFEKVRFARIWYRENSVHQRQGTALCHNAFFSNCGLDKETTIIAPRYAHYSRFLTLCFSFLFIRTMNIIVQITALERFNTLIVSVSTKLKIVFLVQTAAQSPVIINKNLSTTKLLKSGNSMQVFVYTEIVLIFGVIR